MAEPSPVPHPRRLRWQRVVRDCALPAAIAVFALLLRLHGLGAKPFWLDEVTSFYRATGSLSHLVLDALHNRHYPSYFLLLWGVARWGASQALLRLPSAILGAAAAGLACALGRRVAGAASGAAAGLLMALSPFEVQFGQEARSYTLVGVLILVALLGLVRLAQEPAAAARPWRQSGLRGAWLAYGLGTAAALCVLNVAMAWLVVANLGAVAIAWQAGAATGSETRRAFLRRWGIVQLLVVAAWAPWLAAVCLFGKASLVEGARWAPPETLGTIWSALAPVYLLRISDFITFGLAPAAVPGRSAAVAALAALGAWRLRRTPAVLAVIGGAALLVPLGMLLLTPFVPVLVPRYFMWSAAPFFVLAGAGLGGLTGLRFAVAAPVLLAAGLINLAPYYHDETKPRWDLLAARLATEARPGDVVLVNRGYSDYVFSVFAQRVDLAGRGVRIARHLAEAKRLAPGHDLWAVYGRTGQGPMMAPQDYLRSLAPFGRPRAESSVGRYIILWRFAEPAKTEPPIAPQPGTAATVGVLQP
ncbi:MAG: hypothetical protein ACREE1_05455 [Stellaceae bacterium]